MASKRTQRGCWPWGHPTLHFDVVRPTDLLKLSFSFEGFRLKRAPSSGGPPVVERARSPAHIVVKFPPQHILEEAFFEASDPLVYGLLLKAGSLQNLKALHTGETISHPQGPLATELANLAKELALQCGLIIPWGEGVRKDDASTWTIGHGDIGNWIILFTIDLVQEDQEGITLQVIPASTDPTGQQARARLSAPSYLVFDATAIDGFDFRLEAVLDLLRYCPLCLAPVAEVKPGDDPGPAAPTLAPLAEGQTRIEAPFHLIISPTLDGCWGHASQVLGSRGGWAELWHTRLGVLDQAAVDSDRYGHRDDRAHVRAIWLADPVAMHWLLLDDDDDEKTLANAPVQHSLKPFRASLDAADRYNLVHLTSNYFLRDQDGKLVTAPVLARRLMLSALGAWLDLHGTWRVTDISPSSIDPQSRGKALSVSEWRHRATMGRDHYVRVVYEGFLYPFGHRAALVKITERKFLPVQVSPGSKTNIAYLRQRMFLVVREPEKRFGALHDGWTAGLKAEHPLFPDPSLPVDRFLPFSQVRITTLVTPNLDAPAKVLDDVGAQSLFWPAVGGEPFRFQIQALDRDGRAVAFRLPLLFVARDAHNVNNLTNIKDKYNELNPPWLYWLYTSQEAYHSISLTGQVVSYAESAMAGDLTEDPTGGPTAFASQAMTLGMALLENADQQILQQQPALWPVLQTAQVTIPDLQYLADAGEQVDIGYERRYLSVGFGSSNEEKNEGEIFARPVDVKKPEELRPLPLSFSQQSDRSGAVVSPSMEIRTLSRSFGPAAGTGDEVAEGTFNPETVFGPLSGEVTEAKLLGQFPLKEVLDPEATFPKILRAGTATTYTVEWQDVPLKEYGIFTPTGQLRLHVTTDVPSGGGDPSTTIEGILQGFALEFFGSDPFLTLRFRHLRFTSETGRKPEVDAVFEDVRFGPPLSWVGALASLIPSKGFSDPPSVSVTGDGIAASFSLALPTIAVGAFSLQNLSLGAALTMPFIDAPVSVRFNFAERQAPCILTMGLFGGGAFFAVELNTSGMQVLEMALEFGACVAVNLGVASGSIYAMGGIYFKLEESKQAVLYGYFRMGGEVDVLGLVSASIELYLALGYEAGKAVGRASIEVEVEVCFFSTSVTISCERRFAGSDGDPTLGQVMGPYYVHQETGQVLYSDPKNPLFYLDPLLESRAFLYDDSSDCYVAQPPQELAPEPCRPANGPPPQAVEVSPWQEYCHAFVKA